MSRFTQGWSLPYDSPTHQLERDIALMEGGHIAARYVLTVLTGTSFGFDVSEEEFLEALRAFVSENVSPAALQFCYEDEYSVSCALNPTLMKFFYEHTGETHPKTSKEERALVLLATRPELTDSQIRDALKTTGKQMQRWSTFQGARRMQSRYRDGQGDS